MPTADVNGQTLYYELHGEEGEPLLAVMGLAANTLAWTLQMQPFGEALDEAGDADLIDHFRQLPGTGRAHQAAGAGIGGDDRLGGGVGRRVAAAHDGERAVLRARLSARNRRVDEMHA